MLGCHPQVTRLRGHLEQIKHDDRMIKAEGLDSLSEEELRQVRLARASSMPFFCGLQWLLSPRMS